MVMKKVSLLRKISWLFAIIILLSSCERNYIPGFPKDQIDWLPYSLNSKINFISDNDSILSFNVTEYYVPESHYDDSGSFVLYPTSLELIAEDTASNIILDARLGSKAPFPFMGVGIWTTEDIRIADQLYSFYEKFYENSSTRYENIVYPPLDSLEIGGTIYKNVYQLSRNNDSTVAIPHFSKMYIVKGIGFVGLEEANGRMWAIKK